MVPLQIGGRTEGSFDRAVLGRAKRQAERCIKQGVPYQVFNKWFRDRKKRIVPYTFDKGYRFMRIVTEGYKRVYKVEWKDVLAILESPVIREYKLKKEIS